MKALRFILVLPCIIGSWLAAAMLTFQIEYYRVVNYCPSGFREGSYCYAEGWVMYPMWLISFGVSLSAICVVATAAIVSPSHKYQASLITFIIGSFFATILGLGMGFHIPLVFSVMAGAITFFVVVRLTSPKTAASGSDAQSAPV